MIDRIKRFYKTLELRQLSLLSLFFTSFFLFAYIAVENVLENETKFDEYIQAMANQYSSKNLIYFMQYITFFGSSNFLFPAYSILVLFYIQRKKIFYSKMIAFIGLGSLVLMIVFKQIFKRARPQMSYYDQTFGYSFPSGHTLSSFVFCVLLSFLIWNATLKTGWKYLFVTLLAMLTIAVGISRIILNVHYATDVIAGFCLGIIYLLTTWALVKNWR
jgi:membrane-associated phospholipid phosphatase